MAFTAGVAAGALAVYSFSNLTPKSSADKVTVRQISGEKISHESFNFSGGSIRFTTIADGAGVAETEIPKSVIPEAYNWMNRVHTVSFSAGYRFANFQGAYYGLAYSRRFERFSAGIGFDFASGKFFGIKASAGWSW